MFGIFLLLEVFISLFMGFLNLLGMNNSLGLIIILIINLIVFFIYGLMYGKKTNKKAIIEGLITGLLLVLCLFVLSIIIFNKDYGLGTLMYYIFLIISSIIGSLVGKNKKEDSSLNEN